MAEPEKQPDYKDWLVMRLWGRVWEGAEVCILTTRSGYRMARHCREHLRKGNVPGLRRYKTEGTATRKADRLNNHFKTSGFSAIREDKI